MIGDGLLRHEAAKTAMAPRPGILISFSPMESAVG